MADGGTFSSLRQRYVSALSGGESSLRALLGAPSSSWKAVQVSNTYKSPHEDVSSTVEASTSSACVSSRVEGPVILHRKKAKTGPDVIRTICHVPVTDHAAALESFRAVLQNTEIRPSWDAVTEREEVLEIVEPGITVSRSYTKVGWPGNPRDIVSVNKILQDPSKTLVTLSVSLPRSSSSRNLDPPFLQPSPPYVRSHLHLCAFVVTFPKRGLARVAMYWQWDLRSSGMVWGSHITAMPGMLHELVKVTSQKSSLLPFLRGWGREVAVEGVRYEADADTLRLDYGIFTETGQEDAERHGIYLEKSKERRRLERAWEVRLPAIDNAAAGWDIMIDVPALPSDHVEQPGWTCTAERSPADVLSLSRITLRVGHAKSEQDYIPVQVAVQRVAGSKTLRVNGQTVPVVDLQERDPATHTAKSMVSPESLKLDVASINTSTTASSASSTSMPELPPNEDSVTAPGKSKRRSSQQAVSQALATHNKRAYTGFLALLQSPPAKWKSASEIKKVSISSYLSIDSTAVPVYRYEATFVNISIWDLFSVFVNASARLTWDKVSGLERFDFLGEVTTAEAQDMGSGFAIDGNAAAGEGLTSFHAARWKGQWPTVPRHALLLRTAYKSPTSIHVFYTSVPEDPDILELVPEDRSSRAPNSLPSQVYLQAIAIDQISPTTATVTVVDQVDPRGWSKSGYANMAAAVASIGDIALRTGAPPVITQLTNGIAAPATEATTSDAFNAEYKAIDISERSECIIRCDNTIWSTSGLHLQVHPPPDRSSVLIRHSLSELGSGCWITIEHAPAGVESGQTGNFSITVRRGDPANMDRNAVWINDKRVNVEVEELKEEEARTLRAKKRVRGTAYLLDQPTSSTKGLHRSRPSSVYGKDTVTVTEPRSASAAPINVAKSASPPAARSSMEYALSALAVLQELYTEQSQPDLARDLDNWTILSYAENNSPIRISKRMLPTLSAITPVYRVDRTFPSAEVEHVMRLVSATTTGTRSLWDDRILTIEPVSQYGNGCSTSVWFTKPVFPLRGRFAYTANIRAEMLVPAPPGSAAATSSVALFATASVPLDHLRQQPKRSLPLNIESLNPSRVTEAKILLEGWIIESFTSPASVVNDEDDDGQDIERVRCSYFTCSDLPGIGSGPFGVASIRYRLASLFDSLERALQKPSLQPVLSMPVSALQIEGSLQRHKEQRESWSITLASDYTEVISFGGNSCILIVSALKPKAQSTESKADARGKRLSFPGTYQKNGPAEQPSATGEPVKRPAPPKEMVSSASLTNMQKDAKQGSHDTVLLEMTIRRDASVAAYDVRTTVSMLDTEPKVMPSDTTYWRQSTSVPFKLSVVPLSMPAASATRFHLQLSLPTAQLIEPLDHPLSNLTSAPSLPTWYTKLVEGKALLQVQLVPSKAGPQVEGKPLAPLRVSLNGSSIALGNEAEIKERLQALEDEDSRPFVSKLSRVPASGDSTQLPPQLSQPRIINSAYMVARVKPPIIESKSSPAPAKSSPKPASSDRRVGSEATITAAVATIEKAATPLLKIFTVTIPRGKALAGSKTSLERTYRLPFIILVTFSAFLFGCLVRSFLSPLDYVFFSRSTGGVDSALLELLDPKRTWKYAFRILHLRLPFVGHDFVAAFVEHE